MKQRFFKLIMITTLSVAVLVGCGGKKNDESNKSTETTQKKETTEVSSTAIETTEVSQNSQESTTSEKSKEKTDASTQDSSDFTNVTVNGIQIKFPATKESFEKLGWTWSEKYANSDLSSGYITTGGRIGTYPGGVVVSVVNDSSKTKKIQDCTIYAATFYNPKTDSEKVSFIGGLTYNSTVKDVKGKMKSLGYKNPKISKEEKSIYLKYYKDDSYDNYRDYIEFYFYKNSIKSVSISTGY